MEKKLQPENKIMDWHEIRELAEAGFTIGAHTVATPTWRKCRRKWPVTRSKNSSAPWSMA
ncbi:hypothetical protein [Desulforamulus profundi]|uniref:hypothetical protein n=1 Tax=Desulforamulus profundi TaxID=1383067 RepID=UPI001EE52481|nr:hypothetical protein [Desulforamulus profundi]